MTDDHCDRSRSKSSGAGENPLDERLTGHTMKHLGQRGLHARALAGRENDDVGVHQE
jgi:hypothetical protein